MLEIELYWDYPDRPVLRDNKPLFLVISDVSLLQSMLPSLHVEVEEGKFLCKIDKFIIKRDDSLAAEVKEVYS